MADSQSIKMQKEIVLSLEKAMQYLAVEIISEAFNIDHFSIHNSLSWCKVCLVSWEYRACKIEKIFVLLGRKIDPMHTFFPKLWVFLHNLRAKTIPEGAHRRIAEIIICTVAVLCELKHLNFYVIFFLVETVAACCGFERTVCSVTPLGTSCIPTFASEGECSAVLTGKNILERSLELFLAFRLIPLSN